MSAHTPSPSRSSCSVTFPSKELTSLLSLVSLSNFIRIHLMPLSRSLMKVVNRFRPSIDLWKTPLVAGCQFEKELFTTTLCAISQPVPYPLHRPLVQTITHVSLGGGHGKPYQSLRETQVDNVHWSPPSPATASTRITASTKQVTLSQKANLLLQVCQAWLALGESVLAFPNHVLHLTCDSPQKDLFHHFPETEKRLKGLLMFL